MIKTDRTINRNENVDLIFYFDGDAGNLWDIIDIYDADHIHFNALGYAKIGEIIRKKLGIK